MKKFYDSHCHIMNLSHPNLSAMLQRFLRELNPIKRLLIGLGTLITTLPFVGKVFTSLFKGDKRAMNLLAIMETELGDFIMQMEEDLRNNLRWDSGPKITGNGQTIKYDRIVLTPLIMDFGLKEYEDVKTLYKVRWKPIASQVLDLCLGMKYYYKHRANVPLTGANPTTPLFEIHLFMGINTRNYKMKQLSPEEPLGLDDILNKYFTGFAEDTPDSRRAKIEERKWIDFTGNIEEIKPYDYIGIKVYPPLGFNPWPEETWEEDADDEMKKVRSLYEFCQANKIPITAHCSENGFLVDKKYKELSHPKKWAKVLDTYKELRLNLAHFGADNEEWREAIVQLMIQYKNVYTDISSRGVDEKYYGELKKFIGRRDPDVKDVLMKRIIFGSDFMINLMKIDSYAKYMQYFAETDAFTVSEKDMFCCNNAETFLYLR
jgi:hypothetical protein